MHALGVAAAVGWAICGSALAADSAAIPPGPVELNNRAVALASQGRYTEAEAVYRQALEGLAQRADRPETAGERARTLENLGSLLRNTGRYAESETVLDQALSQFQAATGESSADAGHVLENLAALHLAGGDAARAESCALRAAAMLSGPDRTDNQVLLATIYLEQRRFAEARAILEPALPGAVGQLAFTIHASLAAAALGEEKLDDAREFSNRALEIAATAMPPDHIGVAAVWNNLGQACRFQGRYLEAETSYHKAIEIWTAARGPAHPLVARGLLNLAAFEHERGREHAAEELYGRAAGILEQAIGRDSLQTLIARNELGEVLRAEGRYTAAEQLSGATLPPIRKLLPENDPRVLRALANYARLLAATKRQADADALWAHIRLVANTLTTGSLQ
jgi:tetratricopeptide (TPR) repeat protein